MKSLNLYCLSIVFSLSLVNCASLSGKETKIFNNHKLEYISNKGSNPTIVIASGLDGHLELWEKVITGISKKNSIFAYNRPGIGNSEKTNEPRDAEKIIEELRLYLKELNILPPYVLVGHSSGGLYMQLFARKYSLEVAGLVLVDSTHPLQMQGAGSPENWSWWIKLYMNLFLSKMGEKELAAINKSGEQVLSYPVKDLKFPIRILTATEPETASTEYLKDLIEKRKNLALLYPSSKQYFIKGGHVIPLENPQAVVSAIQEVLAEHQR